MHDHCQRCGGCVFVCARRADIQLLAQGVSLLLEVDDLLSYDDGTLLKGGVEFLVLLVGLVYEALVFLVSLGNLDLGMLCATVVCCTCATSCTPPPSRDTSSALAPVRYFLLAGQHSVISNHQSCKLAVGATNLALEGGIGQCGTLWTLCSLDVLVIKRAFTPVRMSILHPACRVVYCPRTGIAQQSYAHLLVWESAPWPARCQTELIVGH